MSDDDDATRERFAQFEREAAAESEDWIARMGLEGEAAESFRNHGRHWILMPGGELVVVPLLEWAKWFGENTDQRIVGRDEVALPRRWWQWWRPATKVRVSTVFLGLDHSFGMSGPPILFETMIFGGGDRFEYFQMRYATLAEAEAGHKLTIQMVQQGKTDWDD